MYTIDGETVAQKNVQIGVVDDGSGIAEIVSGLEEGERVIVGNVGTLGRGMQVRVVDRDDRPRQALGRRRNGMFLSDVSIKRPVFATMMMVALVVLGVVSYKRLAIDEYPDVTYPVVVVQTAYPGRVARGDGARGLAPDRGSAEHRAGAVRRSPPPRSRAARSCACSSTSA